MINGIPGSFTDPEPEPVEIIPSGYFDDRSHPVVATVAAPCTKPDRSEFQMKIIINNQGISRIDRKIVQYMPDRETAPVHMGDRFDKNCPLAGNFNLNIILIPFTSIKGD
jgi:hypothetical protein